MRTYTPKDNLISINNVDINKLTSILSNIDYKDIEKFAGITRQAIHLWKTGGTKFVNKNSLEKLILCINLRKNYETGFITKRINKVKLSDFVNKI